MTYPRPSFRKSSAWAGNVNFTTSPARAALGMLYSGAPAAKQLRAAGHEQGLWSLAEKMIPDNLGNALPGSRVAWINGPRFQGLAQPGRRHVLAHEAFHASNPLLGRFETPAYFYGGYRSERQPSVLNGLRAVRAYWQSKLQT